jgi:hypothetical protein
MNRQDAFDVAQLAAMVGGQLNMVDKFSVERSTNPANKIDIGSFIDAYKSNAPVRPARYLTEAPAGFAPPPPEEFVQASVPDTTIGSRPIQAPVQQIQIASTQNTDVPVNVKLHPMPQISEPPQVKTVVAKNEITILTRNDVDSIRNSLKNIDKTLSGMLKLLQENGKPKVNE